MKKLFSLLLVLATAMSLHANSTKDRGRFVTRVETCEAILREFQADPERAIPASVLQNAKAIVITNQIKAGFIVGLQEGYGIIMVKKDSGWSIPVVVNAGEASFGLQLGGSRIETVYIVTNEQTPRLLFEGRFNIGVDAAAIAGPRVAESEKINRELLSVPVLVYSNQKGLYAGATVKSGYINRSDAINRSFYGVAYDLPELLYGNYINPVPAEVQPLISFVSQITR